jgi:hypothetical protein
LGPKSIKKSQKLLHAKFSPLLERALEPVLGFCLPRYSIALPRGIAIAIGMRIALFILVALGIIAAIAILFLHR